MRSSGLEPPRGKLPTRPSTRSAQVTARVMDGALQVQVRDDGVGGARPDGGGLLGLADRLIVLDGSLRVDSPRDGGTPIAADIPCASCSFLPD
jgi:signal transduction histidine kinase